MLVGLPYLVGYLMVAYARFAVTQAGFISVLLVGRFLTGVGLGWSTLAVSVSNRVCRELLVLVLYKA